MKKRNRNQMKNGGNLRRWKIRANWLNIAKENACCKCYFWIFPRIEKRHHDFQLVTPTLWANVPLWFRAKEPPHWKCFTQCDCVCCCFMLAMPVDAVDQWDGAVVGDFCVAHIRLTHLQVFVHSIHLPSQLSSRFMFNVMTHEYDFRWKTKGN